jgi:hypothetical protein
MDLPLPAIPAASDFKDRHAWLIVFGIFEIMLGAFCALMIPLTFFAQIAGARRLGHPFDFATVVPGMMIFAVASIGLIWLGVGSALARRWARALLLCFGWMGLGVGLITIAILVPILGSMNELMQQPGREVPAAALVFAKVFAAATVFVFYVLIPGVIVLFYRGENVRLTCEVRDPQTRWTDRCPLPVVAASILLVFGALCLVISQRFGAVVPLMGSLVTGWPARVFWFGWAAFSLYAARGFYRLERRVWLIYCGVMLLFSISSFVTLTRVDVLDYYRAMGMPSWQIEHLAQSPVIRNGMLLRVCGLCVLPYFGYLFYLRRFFPANPGQDPPVTS